jgi:hypothetical protein
MSTLDPYDDMRAWIAEWRARLALEEIDALTADEEAGE